MALDIPDTVLSGAVGSIIGAVAGALIPLWISIRREKRTFTLALIAQFDSHPMYAIRSGAWAIIRKYPHVSFDADKIHAAPECNNLWALVGFYKVLGILVKENRADKHLVLEAFGQTFIWWYYASFEHDLLPVGSRWSDLIEPIKYLHDWLHNRVEKPRFDGWIQEARAARQKHLCKSEPSEAKCSSASDETHGQTATKSP